ncbi:hypothetical protein ES708_34150 [subsurface metagenome]
MPLPPEILEDIKRRITDAEEKVKDLNNTLADLRAAGIDASKQEEMLTAIKEDLRRLTLFYGRQSKRPVVEPTE